jgi:Arc/MetJ-type ribon-helix-helix transcriptional regulator
MTIHLPEHIERSIHAAVQSGHFSSMDDAMTEAAGLLLKKLGQEQSTNPPAISEVAPGPPAKKLFQKWVPV